MSEKRTFQIVQGIRSDMLFHYMQYGNGKPYPVERLQLGNEFHMTDSELAAVRGAIARKNDDNRYNEVRFIREKINGQWVVVR